MIDLHLHTTASDGRLPPAALVARAVAAQLTIISVTDHDTTGGLEEAAAAARQHGVRLVSGIEITAVEARRDVHVLAYFFDPHDAALNDFLRAQRTDRLRRIISMAKCLDDLGCPVDVDALIESGSADQGRTIGRPQLADALVSAGHVASRRAAFETLLGEGCPAFVPRLGASVAEVAAIVRGAGGITSLAHPALLKDDGAVACLGACGLTALEVWHSDHDEAAVERYSSLARRLGLGMSGGSDYHADESHHASGIGTVTLSPGAFADLEVRADAGRAAPRPATR